jgi:hypothetical protein
MLKDDAVSLIDYGWATVDGKLDVRCRVKGQAFDAPDSRAQHEKLDAGELLEENAENVAKWVKTCGKSSTGLQEKQGEEKKTSGTSFTKYMNADRSSSGSQKETPTVRVDERGNAVVGGYHGFSVSRTGKVSISRKRDKYMKISALLRKLKTEHGCRSFMDVGANTGVVSFLANSEGYSPVTALDHDRPAIEVIEKVAESSSVSVYAETFDFGSPMPRKADLVYVGSLIHWVWCLTANFEGDFERILRYLFEYTNKILVIEFVEPNDAAIREFGHTKKCSGTNIKEPYTLANFRAAITKTGGVILRTQRVEATRVEYTIRVPSNKYGVTKQVATIRNGGGVSGSGTRSPSRPTPSQPTSHLPTKIWAPLGSAAASGAPAVSGALDATKESLERADRSTEPCFSPTDKLFVCITSYDKNRAEIVKSILGNFEELKVRYGMEVQALIHVTEVPPLKSRFLSDSVEYRLGDPNLKLHFSGLCRHDFKKSLESNAHTHYLMLEDDLNVTASHLTNLCEQFRYLDTFPRDRRLRPGLLRFENQQDINGKNHRVLIERSHRASRALPKCPPQIHDEVLDIGGVKYVVPANEYDASYFLPAEHYKDLLELKLNGIDYDFYATDISPWIHLEREEHAGLWMCRHTTKVVPADTAKEFMVHHTSQNKALRDALPTIEEFIESARGHTHTVRDLNAARRRLRVVQAGRVAPSGWHRVAG